MRHGGLWTITRGVTTAAHQTSQLTAMTDDDANPLSAPPSRILFFPFHRFTGLKSDLFSSEYTMCPKVGPEGGLFVWDSEKKGPMAGTRGAGGAFCSHISSSFRDQGQKGVNWSKNRVNWLTFSVLRGHRVVGRPSATRVNWPSHGQLAHSGGGAARRRQSMAPGVPTGGQLVESRSTGRILGDGPDLVQYTIGVDGSSTPGA